MAKQNSLNQILNLLKHNRKDISVPIPSYWMYPYNDASGKISYKNPYDLLIIIIEDYILASAKKKYNYQVPLKKNYVPVIYGALIRTTTAFDFDNDRKLSPLDSFGMRETGTILRMIFLLPLLKKIGINIIYFLPMTLPSEMYQKGNAPSIYSCKNFLKIDPLLHDPMAGDLTEQTLDMELKAFICACHILEIKVIMDFVPCTAGRDNDLILDHPDWFYWIKEEYDKNFKAPVIPGFSAQSFSTGLTQKIYSAPSIKDYLKKFTFSPDMIDKNRWERLVKTIKEKNIKKFMPLIIKEFHITTSPGFTDVINDPQPAWNDITFLRLNFDPPREAVKFLEPGQPPYILFDGIKASRSKFKKPNLHLWKYLGDIIPHFQKKFGLDGMRIDMAHTLPSELEKEIIKNGFKNNKNFFFVSEDLNIDNSGPAKKAGYNCFIGNLWWSEPRWKNGTFKTFFQKQLPSLSLPVLAASETHDTPRSITRKGKKRFYIFSSVINYFLPGTYTFINTGFESAEIQPMNKGLDPAFCNIRVLPRKDLNYKKLSLFDFTTLHWNNNNEKIFQLMEYCSGITKKYPQIKMPEYKPVKLEPDNLYTFSYYYRVKQGYLLFLINSHLSKNYRIYFSLPFKYNELESVLCAASYMKKNIFQDKNIQKRLLFKRDLYSIKLKKGEISIILLKTP